MDGNFTTAEVGCYQTKDLTFSVSPTPQADKECNVLGTYGSDTKVKLKLSPYGSNPRFQKEVAANISYAEANTLLMAINDSILYPKDFNLFAPMQKQLKIFGNKDDQGYMRATKLTIVRQCNLIDKETGSEVPREYPWTICIENGKAKPIEFGNGGFSMDGKTYVQEGYAYINLTDAVMKDLFLKVFDAFDVYKMTYFNKMVKGYKAHKDKVDLWKRKNLK